MCREDFTEKGATKVRAEVSLPGRSEVISISTCPTKTNPAHVVLGLSGGKASS